MSVRPGEHEAAAQGGLAIVARVGARLCAVPLAHARETMRMLPIEPLADAPPFVLGLAIIRGEPVPVIDLGALVGGGGARGRLIALRVGERSVALAVDAVVGVQPIDGATLAAAPPIAQIAHAEVIEAIGVLDAQLLLVLRASRLLSEDDWQRLARGRA
jgi:purine-binding chemotaxis protein CheW